MRNRFKLGKNHLVAPKWGGSRRYFNKLEESDHEIIPDLRSESPTSPPPIGCWESISLKIKSKLFGSKLRRQRQTEVAIHTCKLALQALEAKTLQLTTLKGKAEANMIRLMKSSNPRAAITYLREKKFYESQLDRVQQHRFKIQSQQLALEESETNQDVFDSLQAVGNSMHAFAMHGSIELSMIDKNKDIIENAMDNIAETTEALEPINIEDEALLWEELLAAEGGHDRRTISLPKAPTGVVSAVTPAAPAVEHEVQVI